MKTDVYSVMHNEEQFLPYFLRHYESFADRIFVWEDQSTDRTREILLAHPKVTVLDVTKHGIDDEYWITELWPQYEQISRGIADWVICVDADELVWHPSLAEMLEYEKSNGVTLINCKGYVMLSDKLPTTDGQIYDELQYGVRDRWSSKWCLFSPDIYIRFSRGRHRIKEIGGNAVHASNNSTLLLHYRYFGSQYFENRDIRNIERFGIADGKNYTYKADKRRNLPDGSRGAGLPWYFDALSRATNIVEETRKTYRASTPNI